MMFILLWGFILLLAVAVIFLIWLQFKNQHDHLNRQSDNHQLENKVISLEENLKKTLEIMQDLAKKMHVQQEALDKSAQRIHQLETQNVELVNLITQVLDSNKVK